MTRLPCLLMLVGFLACASCAKALEPLVTHGGLGDFLHPIQKPEHLNYPCWCAGRQCCCCKDHVYIFGVNGLNPLCTGNFNGLCSYLREEGYENTYFGQLYTSHFYCSKIRKIIADDPSAKVVLIGFSLGTNYVRCMANMLAKDGVKIDLLVYLGGDTIFDTPSSCPENVCRVLNITSHGLCLMGGDLLFKGADLPCARNVRLDTRHILIPSRRETLELIMEELLAISCFPCDVPVANGNGNAAEPLPPPVLLPPQSQAPAAQPTSSVFYR